MRYADIIKYSHGTPEERLAFLGTMYGIEETKEEGEVADTELKKAEAMKLRAEALAAVRKMEQEYEELSLSAEEELLAIVRGQPPK